MTLAVPDYEITTRQVQVGRRTQTYRERKQVVREVPPRQDESSVRRAFEGANGILSQIDVCFDLRQITPATVQMPSNSETVDRQGFLFLANQFPARNCVSLLLVSRFSSRELGGEALEDRSVCIVASLGDPMTGKILAHEFGHLLSLAHVEGSVEAHYNLMYPGLSADARLTGDQRRQAQGSRLVRQFGERRD